MLMLDLIFLVGLYVGWKIRGYWDKLDSSHFLKKFRKDEEDDII